MHTANRDSRLARILARAQDPDHRAIREHLIACRECYPAYGPYCERGRELWLASYVDDRAATILAIPELTIRRQMIANTPELAREQVKERIKELWREGKYRQDAHR